MQKKWILPTLEDPLVVKALSQEFSLPESIVSMLVRRGFDSSEKVTHFLNPRLANLQPPEKIPGIVAASKRLFEALEKKESILLYGDYDVDGITSLALLCRVLKALGGKVDCFIPERAREGYGLSQEGVERCLKKFKPNLFIAIDCGTNSLEEALFIREQDIDLIIVDHHQLAATTAEAACVALVNPQQGKEYHYLCSVGLIFKLVHALLKEYPKPPLDLRHYLDFVALGTVADIVPLVEENRIFVHHGLKQLEHSSWPGLRALIKAADIEPPFTSFDIGYKLGPRINAAGRLADALEALELLLTDDCKCAAQVALNLDRRNRERQAIERTVTLEAEELAAAKFKITSPKSIVLGKSHWHYGIVGIVASRISKRWHRPTFIIGFDEDGKGKGSGRSIYGFSLVEALGQCSHLLEAFGGHAMAAGVTLQQLHLETFSETFEQVADSFLKEEHLVPRLQIDTEINLSELEESWLLLQAKLGPFGTANPAPLFIARSIKPIQEPRLLKEKHLRFEFQGKRGKRINAIFFNGAVDPLPRLPWDMAFTLERNVYQGRTSLQLQVVALREAE